LPLSWPSREAGRQRRPPDRSLARTNNRLHEDDSLLLDLLEVPHERFLELLDLVPQADGKSSAGAWPTTRHTTTARTKAEQWQSRAEAEDIGAQLRRLHDAGARLLLLPPRQ
jgi:hypothetical protein